MLTVRAGVFVLMALLAAGPLSARHDSISASKLSERLADGGSPLVLDVRTEREYAAGHVPGALHIPHTELAAHLSNLPATKHEEVVVYCEQGPRAYMAERVLQDAGYTRVRDLEGHMADWRSGDYPVESQ